MTAKQFIESQRFTTEEPFSYYNQQWLDWMKEFARQMCDKQKEICYTHALPYKEGAFGNYYYRADIKVEKESIINSPYPDELQGNN